MVPPHFMWASVSGSRPPSVESLEVKRKRKLHAAAQEAHLSLKRVKTGPTGSTGGAGKASLSLSVSTATSTSAGAVVSSLQSPNGIRHIKFTYEEAIMEMVDADLLKADQTLSEIYQELPPNALMLVLTQPDVTVPAHLAVQRMACLDNRATLPWTEENERMFVEVTQEARRGLVMMRVR